MNLTFESHLTNNDIFKTVSQAAKELNVEVYVIGGYVRDLVMGRISNEIDFVTIGTSEPVARRVATILGENAKMSIYKNFGTASVHLNDAVYEFVGARKESYRKNSRNPVVEDGTFLDDLSRRDFTINTLAISLNEQTYGELYDHFNGIKDIEKQIITTCNQPDITFSDDPLRMMRAIRFATQLKFDISPDTINGIKKQVERIRIVSWERITDELNKIILCEVPSYGFNLLFECGIMQIIFPEFAALQGVEMIDGIRHKDNFYHTLKVLDKIASRPSAGLWLRWSAILHDIAKPATKRFNKKSGWTFHGHEDLGARWVPRIFKRLKLPMGQKMKYVQKLVRLHLRPIALVSDIVTDSAVRRLIFEAGTDIMDLITLCRSDVTSNNLKLVKKYQTNFDKLEKKIARVEEKDKILHFKTPISGSEIMEIFDIKPSKQVGIIKNEVKEAIITGTIKNDRKEAYQFTLKVGTTMGLVPTNSLDIT